MIGIGGAGQAMQFDDELHMAASPFIDDGKGGGVLEPVAPSVNKDSIERDAMEESEMRSTLPPRPMKISDGQGNEFDYSDIGNTSLGVPDLPTTKKDLERIQDYHSWLDKNKLKDSDRYDYDIQGAYMNGVEPSENGHLPDTYKKPNHPTFSDESIYHGGTMKYQDDPDYTPEGGHWEKLEDGKYSFTPGKSNLDHHTTQELMDYFKKYEPDNKLILPGQ